MRMPCAQLAQAGAEVPGVLLDHPRVREQLGVQLAARRVSGCPKICKLAHAFLWECSDKRLELAQLLRQLVVFLTCSVTGSSSSSFDSTYTRAVESFPCGPVYFIGDSPYKTNRDEAWK